MISTTGDLNRFFAALLGGELLQPASLAAMQTMVDTDDDGRRYGLGLEQVTLPCGTVVWRHDGDFIGYSATAFQTLDGRRQLTVSLTPLPAEGSPAEHLTALTQAALCD